MIEDEITAAVDSAEAALAREKMNATLRRLGTGVGTRAERKVIANAQWARVLRDNAAIAEQAKEQLRCAPMSRKLAFQVRFAVLHPNLFNEFLLNEGLEV